MLLAPTVLKVVTLSDTSKDDAVQPISEVGGFALKKRLGVGVAPVLHPTHAPRRAPKVLPPLTVTDTAFGLVQSVPATTRIAAVPFSAAEMEMREPLPTAPSVDCISTRMTQSGVHPCSCTWRAAPPLVVSCCSKVVVLVMVSNSSPTPKVLLPVMVTVSVIEKDPSNTIPPSYSVGASPASAVDDMTPPDNPRNERFATTIVNALEYDAATTTAEPDANVILVLGP